MRGGRTRGRSNARGRGTGRPHRAIPRQGVEVGTKKGPVDAKADRDRGPQQQARRGPPPRAAGRATLHKFSASLRQEHASGRRPDPAQLALPLLLRGRLAMAFANPTAGWLSLYARNST